MGSGHIVLLFIAFSIVSIGILSFLPDASAKNYGVGIPTNTAVPGCEESDKCYTPSTIFIEIGDEIEWHNWDNVAHTVTSVSNGTPDGMFDSGLFTVYTTFLVKFDGKDGPGFPGEFDYICKVHPWMKGKVILKRTIHPPVILQPSDIEVYTKDPKGRAVTFDVFAFDDTDHKVKPYCHPRSGSFFSIGGTHVTCFAIDMTGNKAQRVSFTVNVFPIGAGIQEAFAYPDDDVQMFVTTDKESYKPGEILTIKGTGAHSYSVWAKIISPDGDELTELKFLAPGSGEFSTAWIIPKSIAGGIYTIEARDIIQKTNTNFEILSSSQNALGLGAKPNYVTTEKESYDTGEKIGISGFIKPQSTYYPVDVTLLIQDSIGNIVTNDKITPASDGTFETSIVATGAQWLEGEYTIKANYLSETVKTTFQLSPVIDEVEPKVPDWVRNIFIWYAQEQISEDELLEAIQFLFDQGILQSR